VRKDSGKEKSVTLIKGPRGRVSKKKPIIEKVETVSVERSYAENNLAMQLFGSYHAHLAHIEQALGGVIYARGNHITISGSKRSVDLICEVLDGLYGRLKGGQLIDLSEVATAIRMVSAPIKKGGGMPSSKIYNRYISPRTSNQTEYLKAINALKLVFGQGPAGTGKTYLAIAMAVEQLVSGVVDRIILSRPAVEAGEQLGFLPGDMREKVDPYLRPLYDALYQMLPESQVVKRLESGEIEIAPLAFMRGRTLANAFIILDEAQNTTSVQMKMFLTRLGKNSQMVVTGDLTQIDLPNGVESGLHNAMNTLNQVEGVKFINFDESDVIRHSLVARIVNAYSRFQNQNKLKKTPNGE